MTDQPAPTQPSGPKKAPPAAHSDPVPPPAFRRLRGYAFDPSLSIQLETMGINEIVFKVPWEEGLGKGPIGEYLEVIDVDPPSRCFYEPVDLENRRLIAQDGLSPAVSNPQFHQQMVYAVAMTTIRNFEQALGRKALWRAYIDKENDRQVYVQKLRIYPHAIREANAYYSPKKKALLFGYFPATSLQPGTHLPGGMVFTCLSHDVVAHETTHALLDGMHRRLIENSNPDALAFHEAFADIVALFQHFSFPEVLKAQIARTRGDLSSENLLGQLAQEFGVAIGNYGALRDAIGRVDKATGQWQPQAANPEDYRTVVEPHARGSILVAAVFDAFISIYKHRVADLLRIATGGTGVLPTGALHPDLVNRLADEAAKAARHVLLMCIRAMDYTPVIDLDFGDYLRSIITADKDLVPADELGYRVAFIEAFRRRGIYPRDVRNLALETLYWPSARADQQPVFERLARRLRRSTQEGDKYYADRLAAFNQISRLGGAMHEFIAHDLSLDELAVFQDVTGLVLLPGEQIPGLRIGPDERPVFEVHSVRPARRVGPDGNLLNQMLVSITQQRSMPFNQDNPGSPPFRGGTTLILDLDTFQLSYHCSKSIRDDARWNRQLAHMQESLGGSLRATYFAPFSASAIKDAFAVLHREF